MSQFLTEEEKKNRGGIGKNDGEELKCQHREGKRWPSPLSHTHGGREFAEWASAVEGGDQRLQRIRAPEMHLPEVKVKEEPKGRTKCLHTRHPSQMERERPRQEKCMSRPGKWEAKNGIMRSLGHHREREKKIESRGE